MNASTTTNNDAQKILITGPAGSGKSFISAKLKEQGINAVDADTIHGLGQWVDENGNKVEFPPNASAEWLAHHQYIWDKNFLRSWLEQQSAVYFFGLAANIFEVVDLFHKAYYLNPTPKLLRQRFAKGERKNSMGQTKEQREAVIRGIYDFAQKARDHGLVTIDADQTPNEIFEVLEFG